MQLMGIEMIQIGKVFVESHKFQNKFSLNNDKIFNIQFFDLHYMKEIESHSNNLET